MSSSSPVATSAAEPEEARRGEIPATQWAHAYESRYTKNFEARTDLLSHLNCGYFSTRDNPPTLLALKKHAQSLVILIKNISVSTEFCLVDGVDRVKGHNPPGKYRENEAFDFLTDLSTPYENDDEWHHKPLIELMNKISGETDTQGTTHHCPLEKSRIVGVKNSGAKVRPYCNHETLAQHANECLEILDHEYSATGGLMSLLPTEDERDKWQMDLAENCILGQWLLYNQHLVGRMHELEMAYATALDTLGSEAIVPLQAVSKALGGNGTGEPTASGDTPGREIGFPQDRWVLANAGDDVFDYVHRVLDRQEALIEPKERVWKEAGVMGERMWREQRGGAFYAAGLVAWDVTTRYVRLRGKTRSPIFIIPAHGEHPGVAATRQLETQPKVVSVPTPSWPVRASNLQRKHEEDEDRVKRAEEKSMNLDTANIALASAKRKHEVEIDRLRKYILTLESQRATEPGKGLAEFEAQAEKQAEEEEVLKLQNKLMEETWRSTVDMLPEKYHKKLWNMHKDLKALFIEKALDRNERRKKKSAKRGSKSQEPKAAKATEEEVGAVAMQIEVDSNDDESDASSDASSILRPAPTTLRSDDGESEYDL